ncbi:hypothetical protein K7472_17470 [Streptomyces sp. PTM05]|uniref:Uncharacterized protein n=1 Tax=Streptantibioticus parmotrematis TaxID=2873249 RepID=A0ABS7QTW9_9ACTN|nr:hypothetical protein [Streptantibioticus parmotrematis]MBY8886642.1 hypothetical protein [Streptantibioticus parmotrematis]
MTIRTTYYTEDARELPSFTGPAELKILGHWVTSDIQLSPYAVLEAIDLARTAQANPAFEPESMDGNAFTVTFSPEGLVVENLYVDHVRGEFTLDQALRVLLDFWEYCRQAIPAKIEDRRREYLEDHGRDPLAGIRDPTDWQAHAWRGPGTWIDAQGSSTSNSAWLS